MESVGFEVGGLAYAIIEIVVVAIVGFLISRNFHSVSNKLDKVLLNQQEKDVEIAEIKKDMANTVINTKENTGRIVKLEDRIQEVEVKQGGILEWKQNIQ